ncbi:MAG: GNAT family N-acetyltransferase [Butyrivibrio sp.]|nr:GNAT family N-acetyltransferase [Butyrivibrio sp.]
MIRKAERKDLSRIAEILVFVKRIKYRPIFQNDDYSFGDLQVIRVAEEYDTPEILDNMWVYDDGIVKGLIHVIDKEVAELYVDYFFWGQGIGAALLEFAKDKFKVNFLWALEKNADAIRFYEAHGFYDCGERKLEEDTPEYLIKMKADHAGEKI